MSAAVSWVVWRWWPWCTVGSWASVPGGRFERSSWEQMHACGFVGGAVIGTVATTPATTGSACVGWDEKCLWFCWEGGRW